jgi:hypothetical protein
VAWEIASDGLAVGGHFGCVAGSIALCPEALVQLRGSAASAKELAITAQPE